MVIRCVDFEEREQWCKLRGVYNISGVGLMEADDTNTIRRGTGWP